MISKVEKKYIELVYKGFKKTDEIAVYLKIPEKKVLSIQHRIFDKLVVHSWYMVIRRSFELGILSADEYCSLDIKAEIDKTTQRIKKIDFSQCDDNVKFKIYNELIELYNKYEYNILLKQFNTRLPISDKKDK